MVKSKKLVIHHPMGENLSKTIISIDNGYAVHSFEFFTSDYWAVEHIREIIEDAITIKLRQEMWKSCDCKK